MKHFQARSPLLDEQSKSTKNEQRINALLRRAQSCCDDVDKLHKEQRNSYESRKSKLLVWRKMMFDKINQIYGSCLTDFQQSFHLLNSFRDLMLVILNDRQESHIDANKLSILENEICILRCLTYHLDTSKVKFDGKLRIIGSQWSSSHSILLGNHEQMQNKHENEQPDVMKDIPCRILVDKDTLTKIQDLDVFKESIQMRNHQVNDGQPERVLTISGSDYVHVIHEILSHLYSSASNSCELRILLHQSYVPFIVGKLGDNAKMLREKYSLHNLTIHPICAPQSTERVVLIQSSTVEHILNCLKEIFETLTNNPHPTDQLIFYDEVNYSPYFAHEYGGFSLPEAVAAAGGLTHLNDQRQMARDRYDEDYEDEGVKRYSALDAWNGSVEADTENELSVVRLGDDCIKREFLINHGQFGALLGPHGIRIAQIRSQCRTVRIHTVAGSSINTCSVQVMGPRVDVSHAVNLIMQSIKEHDRKFPFKHHRFSGRLR